MKIVTTDKSQFLIEASKGKRYLSIEAQHVNGETTQLMITADAQRSKEELALRALDGICSELNIEWEMEK